MTTKIISPANLRWLKTSEVCDLLGVTEATLSKWRARTPLDKSEAPWAGGVIKFGLIVPFKLTYELVNPQKLKMVNQVFSGTKVGSFTLRRGFAPISDEDGEFILDKISGK